jgi:pimeloyl-ACP methyl ester carboxylesterase
VSVFKRLMRFNRQTDFSAGISAIKAPVLLLWGKKDRWLPVSQVTEWQQDLPSIKTIIYETVGHVPQLEIPEQSARDAHAFLAEVLEKK